jgi:hypothetical protein
MHPLLAAALANNLSKAGAASQRRVRRLILRKS